MKNLKSKKISHPWLGKKIGQFLFEKELGKGACATVFLAHDNSSGRKYAVKVLYDSLCKNSEYVNSFVEEARKAIKLKHPNILRVYSVATFENRYFMVSEFAVNGTVQDMLDRKTKIPLKEAVRMAHEAAEGLMFAENKGIVHRDIKPANLLISKDSSIKIADLGIADKKGGDSGDADDIYGSPHYMAPEQAMGKPVTSQSDIYSLGATLYHMLTGKTPFTATGRRGLIMKHLNEKPVPVNRVVPTIPKKAGDTINLMMAKKPEDRFQNFAQVITALELLENLKTLDKLRLSRYQRKER